MSSFFICELAILIYLINGIGKFHFIQPHSDLLICVPKFRGCVTPLTTVWVSSVCECGPDIREPKNDQSR